MVREEHSAPVQLLQNDQLLTFLQAKLEQLEAAQGVPDSEARGKLEQLKQQTTALAAAQQRAAAMDLASAPEATDQQLARSLNRLDNQLSSVEQQLGQVDPETAQLLSESASRWISSERPPSGT